MSYTCDVPSDIEPLLVDITEVNQFIMSLPPDERRKFTKELKSLLAMLIVAHKSRGKQVDIRKLSEMLRLGFDKSYAQEELHLGLRTGDENGRVMITVASQLTILTNGLRYVTRSGVEIYVPHEVVTKLKNQYGTVLECFKQLHAVKVVKRQVQRGAGQQRTIIVARDVKPLVSSVVDERVTSLYQKYKPIDLMLYLLGIRPSPRTIHIMLPKLLYWFIVENEPIHCAIFEPPETGKSHIAIIMSTVCKFYYTTEPPSKAFFIHDARQRTSESIVTMYNGIILDEAEKSMPRDASGWEEFLTMCMTGMEQGKWTRSRGYGQTIEKMFTVVLQGNTLEEGTTATITEALEGEAEAKIDTRHRFVQLVRHYVRRLNPQGLAQRFSYVTWREHVEPITPHLINRFAPTPVLRGLWTLIQNDIDRTCIHIKPRVKQLLEKLTGRQFGYESRAFRHVYKVATVLHVLFRLDVDETLVDYAREMVKFGEIDLRHIEEMYTASRSETPEEKHVENVTTVEQREEESEPPV